jgi:DNA-binding CsgD family transcriptional regulator
MHPSQPQNSPPPQAPRLDMSWLDPGSDGRWMDSSQEATKALGAVLGGRIPGGAILTGDVGDRRETIEAALAAIAPERRVYRLHGSPFAASTPYGALSILLSGLEQSPPEHLHGLVRALADYLRPPGEDPAIVIVSHADQIDPGTITVLSQLAHIHRITLVVHGERPTEVPVEWAALKRAGLLVGITVWPLTPAAAHRLVEDVLGGTASRFASTVLWRHSGGSVSRLRQMVRDCVATGKLHQAESCWVLHTGPLPSPNSVGMQSTALRDLPARQRALLEMLAICGPMRVGDLIHTGYAAELDALHDESALAIRNDHSGRYAELTAVQAAEALAAIEPDRRRELDLTLEALDPGRLSVIRAADDLVATGDVQAAVSLFTEAAWASGPQASTISPTARTHLAWSESRARAVMGDLDGAYAVVRDFPEKGSAALTTLAAGVAVARGDIREAQAQLDRLPSERHPDLLGAGNSGVTDEAIRWRAQVTRAEALAMGDDQAGALRILGELDRELAGFRVLGIANDVISPFERAVVAESMLSVLLTCGQLDRCREVAEAIIDGRHGNPHAVQYADLVLAALDALSGLPDRATQRACRAAAQLGVNGNPHDLHLAGAIKVFCSTGHSDAGEVESSRMLEATVELHAGGTTDQPLGRLGWLAELFLGWATEQIHSAEARTARILALADRAAAAGLHAVEFCAVASAFQLGELWLAPRLAETAEGTQLATSRPNLLLARSVLEGNRELLVKGLEELAAAGYSGHLDRMDFPLLKDLAPNTLRRITESAAALAGRRVGGRENAVVTAEPDWMGELTRREREIARLVVDGKTNAAIARISGISIRTVEGHLYQIYAKLQLKGRSELTRLAAAHAHSHHVS